MYKFIIKSINGEVLHTSIRNFDNISEAQLEGSKFLAVSRLMSSRMPIAAKTNYVDVIIQLNRQYQKWYYLYFTIMKKIELKECSKIKILEMCLVLFNEYDITFIEDDYSYVDYLHIWNIHKKTSENMHWFEFCIMHIYPKLNELIGIPNNKIILPSDKGIFIENTVDHLYKKFKNHEKINIINSINYNSVNIMRKK